MRDKVPKLTKHNSHSRFLMYFNLENNENLREFTITYC